MDLNFILTVMGVALGGVSIGVSVWVAFFIYRKQKDSQTVMDKFVQDSLEMLRTYEQTSFDLLVGIRNNNFQLFARHFETDKSGYWHFKLRFESWNRLSIQVTPDDGESFARVIALASGCNRISNNCTGLPNRIVQIPGSKLGYVNSVSFSGNG